MTCYGLNNLMRQDLVNPNQSLTCGLNQNYGSQGFLQVLLNGTYSGCGYYGNSGYYNPTYTSYFPGQMNLGFNAGASVANYVCSLGNMIVTSICNNRKENASTTVDQDLKDINKKIESLMTDLGITRENIKTETVSDGEIKVTISKDYESSYSDIIDTYEKGIDAQEKLLQTYLDDQGNIKSDKTEDYLDLQEKIIAAKQKLKELKAEEAAEKNEFDKKIEELKSLILNRIGAENCKDEREIAELNGKAPKDKKYSSLIESYFDQNGAINNNANPTPEDVQALFAFYVKTDPSNKDVVANQIHELYYKLDPGEQTPSLQRSYNILKEHHNFS